MQRLDFQLQCRQHPSSAAFMLDVCPHQSSATASSDAFLLPSQQYLFSAPTAAHQEDESHAYQDVKCGSSQVRGCLCC